MIICDHTGHIVWLQLKYLLYLWCSDMRLFECTVWSVLYLITAYERLTNCHIIGVFEHSQTAELNCVCFKKYLKVHRYLQFPPVSWILAALLFCKIWLKIIGVLFWYQLAYVISSNKTRIKWAYKISVNNFNVVGGWGQYQLSSSSINKTCWLRR